MAKITGRRLKAPVRRANTVVLLDAHSKDKLSRQFQVQDTPVVVTMLGAGEATAAVYVVYSVDEDARLEPYTVDGVPVTLSQDTTSVVIRTAGQYKVLLEGEIGPVVYVERQQIVGDYPYIPIKQASGVQANRPNLFLDNGRLSNRTQIIEIGNKPWVFTAFGLSPTERITVYVTYGSGTSYREEEYRPDGIPQVMSPDNNALKLDRSGRYRFVLDGTPDNVLLVGNETLITPTATTGGGGDGSVTRVDTGVGLTGGPITTIGTIRLSAATIASLVRADSALQPGDNVSELVNDAGYIGEAPIDGQQYARKDAAWALLTDGGGLVKLVEGVGYVAVDNTDPVYPIVGLTPEAIQGIDLGLTALQPGDPIPAGDITGLAVVATTGDYNDLLNTPFVLPEAPIDGNIYGRKDGVWTVVTTSDGIVKLVTGTGYVEVDNTDPAFPNVSLTDAANEGIDLGISSIQPGDNISELTNNVGYLTQAVLEVIGSTDINVDSTDPAYPILTLTNAVHLSLGRADTALQPGAIIPASDVSGLATVATTGDYNDLINTPPLLTDAPSDGSTYGRRDGAWVVVTGGGGGGGTVTQVDTGSGLTGGPITGSGTISLGAATLASLALADSALQPGAIIPASDVSGLALVATTGSYNDLIDAPTILPEAPVDGSLYARRNAAWEAFTLALGTVTQVNTGTGLTGGPVTNVGTISLDAATQASLVLANSALQPGAIIPASDISGLATVATTGDYNDLINTPPIPAGTVVSVNTGAGLTGGPITVSGTLALDAATLASLALADSALQPGDTIPASDVSGLATVATTGDYDDLVNKPAIPAGTVTSVGTGTGLTGGPITGTGVISLDAATLALLAKADTALQPGDDIPASDVTGLAIVATTGSYNDLLDKPALTGGTVTQVNTGTGLTGGPITGTGTVALNATTLASLALADSALQPGAIIPASDVTGLATVATTGQYADLLGTPFILPEAPIDGQQYARKDGAWTVVTGGGGGSGALQDVLDTGNTADDVPIVLTDTSLPCTTEYSGYGVEIDTGSFSQLAALGIFGWTDSVPNFTAIGPTLPLSGENSIYTPNASGTLVLDTMLATVATTGDYDDLINKPTLTGGTVTSVGTGTGLTGGPITGSGTISLNSASIASLALADSALQPGDNVSELVNDAGYITSLAGVVPTSRTIATTAPLAGGGDLSANRTLSISAATPSAAGSMSAADKTKLDGIAAGATANTGTVTSVSATGSTGLTVGGVPITTAGSISLTLSANLQAWHALNPSTALGNVGPTAASATGIDLDTLATSGWQHVATSTPGNPMSGTADGQLLHMQSSNGDASQLFFGSTNNILVRVQDSGPGTWGAWNTLYHSGNFANGTTAQYIRGDGSLATFPAIPAGTVTSVAAGNGLNFTTITGSGSVTLGTPSTVGPASTNSVTSTSHTHNLDLTAAYTWTGAHTFNGYVTTRNSGAGRIGIPQYTGTAYGDVEINYSNAGNLGFYDTTNGAWRFRINAGGKVAIEHIPDLPGSIITSGKVGVAYIPHLSGSESSGYARLSCYGDNNDTEGSFRILTAGASCRYYFNGASVAILSDSSGNGYWTGRVDAASLTTSGTLTTGTGVNSIGTAGQLRSSGAHFVVSCGTAGMIYLRPNGDTSSTGQVTVSTAGDLNASGTVSDSSGNVRKLKFATANATTTLAAGHLNGAVEKSNTTAYTYTIAPSLGAQGDAITIVNSGTAGNITLARGSGVALYRNGVDANITVGPGSMVTIYRSATANRWIA